MWRKKEIRGHRVYAVRAMVKKKDTEKENEPQESIYNGLLFSRNI